MSDSLGMCISCDNFYLPPIYQCPKAHLLCTHCTQDADYMVSTTEYNLRKPKLKSISKLKLFCGNCMKYYYTDEEMRKECIEDSMKTVKYPCIYRKDGCQFEDSFSKIERHNETCSFMVVNCFWNNCLWTGILSDMKNHLKYHTVIKTGCKQLFVNNSCFSVFYNDSFYSFRVILTHKTAKFYVIYHGEPDENKIEIHIGAKSSFKYPIKIIKIIPSLKNSKDRSINFNNAECIVVNFEFVKEFFPTDKRGLISELHYVIYVSELGDNIRSCSNPLDIPRIE